MWNLERCPLHTENLGGGGLRAAGGPHNTDDGSAPCAMLTSLPIVCPLVLLLLSSSLESPIEGQPRIRGKDIMVKVKTILGTVNNLTDDWDCKLYTPSLEEFGQKCPVSTINCFAVEVKVLIRELDIRLSSNISAKLVNLAHSLQQYQTQSQCVQCELFEEESPAEFLRRLLDSMEEMNWRFP